MLISSYCLTTLQVYEFKRAWQIFDERGTGSMKLRYLPLLLRRLGEPLGTSRWVIMRCHAKIQYKCTCADK